MALIIGISQDKFEITAEIGHKLRVDPSLNVMAGHEIVGQLNVLP